MGSYSPPRRSLLEQRFADRRRAGNRLGAVLTRLKDEMPVVLALPRGGVPVAHQVAEALDAPLEVLLVAKIAAPSFPDLAVGAVVDGDESQVVLNESIMQIVQVTPDYIESESRRQRAEIDRRHKLYAGGRAAISLQGRTVILVDDGIGTGSSVRAALKALGKAGVRRRIVAVPVAPRGVLESLANEAEEVLCLYSPEPFHAVSLYYENFSPVTDEDVVDLIEDNWRHILPRTAPQLPRAGI